MNNRTNIRRFAPLILSCIVFSVLITSASAFSQTSAYERSFPLPKAEVENALHSLQAYSGGRLPVLEGFVESGEQTLESFSQPYYQYSIKITAVSPNETLVRVTARVTAWFSSEDGSHSGYRMINSNGRLEADLFDRLNQALKTNVAAQQKVETNRTTEAAEGLSAPSAGSAPVLKAEKAEAQTKPAVPALPDSASKAKSTTMFRAPESGALSSEAAAPKPEEISRDKQLQQLREQTKTLQDILDHQTKPDDLAVVTQSRTPVLSRPAEGATVLLLASVEDEFQVLKVSGDWVHVQMTGVARGWIRRQQLDLSYVSARLLNSEGETLNTAVKPPGTASAFQETKEETGTFPGDWQPLKGKKVKIVWVQANDAAKSATDNRVNFVKSVFRKQYPELSKSASELAGVVVVFDEADGGMAAATVATLEQLNAGKLSDSAFWQQCWTDPPEAFRKSTSR